MKVTKEMVDQLKAELKALENITNTEELDMGYLNRVRTLILKARDYGINLTLKTKPLDVRFYETNLERSLKSATEQASQGDPILMESHLNSAVYAAKKLNQDISDRVRGIRNTGYLCAIVDTILERERTTDPEQRHIYEIYIQNCARSIGVDLGDRLKE
jgi:hypothetical protein